MRPDDVLDFWFAATSRPYWFEASPAFDALVRERLLPLRDAALAGKLDGWAAAPDGALALVILFDQVPRNCCRGAAEAFASDVAARAVADELQLSHVINGCVWKSGDRYVVIVNLIHAAHGTQLWAREYHVDAADTLSLQTGIAAQVVREVRARLSSQTAPVCHLALAA